MFHFKVDLNRQWLEPSPHLHAPIFYTKELVRSIHSLHGHEALLYMDLHCHFGKKNIFIYGCDGGERTEEEEKEENGSTGAPPGGASSANVRSFPYLLSQKAPCFSFADCSFKVYSHIYCYFGIFPFTFPFAFSFPFLFFFSFHFPCT